MTKRTELTATKIERLRPKAGGRASLQDSVVPGLAVRCTPGGHKSFVLWRVYPGTSTRTARALGNVGEITLDAARARARKWNDWIAAGVDPAHAEEAERNAALRKLEHSFEDVAEDYFAYMKRDKQRKAARSEQEIRKEFCARWRKRPIASITRNDVVAVIKAAVARDAPYQAHNLLGHAKRLFSWAIGTEEYGLESSPCDRLRPKALIGSKRPRKRVLADDELFALWRVTGRMGYPIAPLYRLLLLNGVRLNEFAQARRRELHPDLARIIRRHRKQDGPINWAQVPDAAKLLTVPPERFKSDAEHLVPLSNTACAIVADLPRFTEGDFLFTTTGGERPVYAGSKVKERIDRRMLRTLRALARMRGDDVQAVTLPPWVNHDLRRTLRTRLSALRVEDHVAEMVIGHGRKGIQRTYDQHRYLPEMRAALCAWEAALLRIVEPRAAQEAGGADGS